MRSKPDFILFLLSFPLIILFITIFLELRRSIAEIQPFNLDILVSVFLIILVAGLILMGTFFGFAMLIKSSFAFVNKPTFKTPIQFLFPVRWRLWVLTLYPTVIVLSYLYLSRHPLLNIMEIPPEAAQNSLRLLFLALLDGIPLGLLAGGMIQILDGNIGERGFSLSEVVRYGILFSFVIGLILGILYLNETRLEQYTVIIFILGIALARGVLWGWDRRKTSS